MSKVRTRYLPSPTGPFHVGGARTALFNYLFAVKHGGQFIVRIEDTDLLRSQKIYEEDIMAGLKWLGLAGDENIEKGGPFAPYRQSERILTYKKYTEKLLKDGKAFYCFHSAKELGEERAKLLEQKNLPLHLCEYRDIDPEEAKTLSEAKPEYIIRFKTPLGRKIDFQDLIRGKLEFDSDLLGDFSIARRTDALPLYNLAVVIDDHEMKITHVIRGDDHIANTPKQIILIEALGLPLPEYAHLPLILGPDRSKLSKRHGETSVIDYQKQGYLPETMFNFLALLGWNPGDDREILSREDIIKEFSLERVQKSGAIFDLKKLDWMNGEYIRKLSPEELYDRSKNFLPDGHESLPKELILKILLLEQPRLKKLSEIGESVEYFFHEPQYNKELLRWKDMGDKEIVEALDISEKIISNFTFPISKSEIEKIFMDSMGDRDRGKILWPLRVALTGKKASPGPFEILEILDPKEAKKRLNNAKKLLV